MQLWKIKFERINFGVKPTLVQTSDVIFRTDIPLDNDHIEEFENCAWGAMWEQNPHWKNPKPPIEGIWGWSSVLSSGRYEKVEICDD